MTAPAVPAYAIEAFDPSRHEREGFSCGVEQVDNFLKRTANKLSSAENLRVFVMTDGGSDVIGFYALNAHAINYGELPARFARTRPGHGSIPAAYLSMIGVDRRYVGRGLGGDLLVDALTRVALAADSIGIAVLMLDVLDDGNPELVARRKRLYEGYGFSPLPSRPLRPYLPVTTIRRLLEERNSPPHTLS